MVAIGIGQRCEQASGCVLVGGGVAVLGDGGNVVEAVVGQGERVVAVRGMAYVPRIVILVGH